MLCLKWIWKAVSLAGLFAVFASESLADTFTDNFATGFSGNFWVLRTNTSLFTVSTGSDLIGFSKPSNSGTGLHHATLCSLLVAQGNFDVRVDFTNANVALVNGTPGNQIQLNTRFGAQDFLMVRSDETSFGQNAHVFPNPPGTVGMGVVSWTTNSGTLRVARTGTLVQGFIDSTLAFQNNYNTNDATFSFVLQNNGTSDAISVQFSNFRLTADHIVNLRPQLTASRATTNTAAISWKDTSWPDFLRGYRLQSTSNLAGVWGLATNQGTLSSNRFSANYNETGNATFFRLLQGP